MKRPTSEEPEQRETRNPVARAFVVLRWMVDATGGSWALGEIAKGVAMHPSTNRRVSEVTTAEKTLLSERSENPRLRQTNTKSPAMMPR